MKVLIACEFSGIVRDAFAARGHDAWSCDLLPTERPGNHIQGDVLNLLGMKTSRSPSRLNDNHPVGSWDLMIAFPPCKYICNGGNNWLNRRPDLKWRENRGLAAEFFMRFVTAWIPKIAIENPIGSMSSMYRKPDQIIRPFMFGHEYNKDICLWLKNLPKLEGTKFIPPPYKHLDYWSTERHKNGRDIKAITFQGVAAAMAEQWG
jgi:hypothetical protein